MMVSSMASLQVNESSLLIRKKSMKMKTTLCGSRTKQLPKQDSGVLEINNYLQLEYLANSLTTSFKNNSIMIMLLECLMDIACFPKDTKIPAAALLDIWVELRKLTEDDAYEALVELERNLISLVRRRDESAGVTRSFSNLYVLLHPLEIYLSQKANPSNGNSRVCLEQRNDGSWNSLNQNATLYPQLLSLHTGEVCPTSLPDVSLGHVEVLILNIVSSSTTFFLPQFLERMDNLKVLIISNYSSGGPALLANLLSVRLPQSLRRIRFDRVFIPLLSISSTPLLNLEKLSMISCVFSSTDHQTNKQASIDIPSTFPSLEELEIDYCNNLSAVPDDLCNITTLQKLRITNCPDLVVLPDSVGKLSHLKSLALEACASLQYLPDSICMLKNLQSLDLSDCSGLEELPTEIGELSSLKTIDTRRCFELIELPSSIKHMKCLRKVVCDGENVHLWRHHISFLSTDLDLSIPKESINLDWLV